MPSNPNEEKQNIVELAKARKQMQTLKAKKEAQKKPLGSVSLNGKSPNRSTQTPGRRSLWEYLQFVFFLAMAAYLIQLCGGSGI